MMNNAKYTSGPVRVRGTGALLMVSLSLVLLSGCVKRDLEYRPGTPGGENTGMIDIALDWNGDKRPQEARYLIYREEDGTLYRSFEGITDGYKGELPEGKYHLIVHNTDAQQVGYCGMENYRTAYVFALPETTVKAAQGSSYIKEPDAVYGIGRCEIGEVFEVRKGETLVSTVHPKCLTHRVELLFELKNMEMRAMKGYLEGVTPSVVLSSGEYHPANCAVAFSTTVETQGVQFAGAVNIFDIRAAHEDAPGSNTLDLTMTDLQGTDRPVQIDITRTVNDIVKDNGGKIPSEISVKIELVLIDNGNLQATVTPWDDGGTGGGHPFPER